MSLKRPGKRKEADFLSKSRFIELVRSFGKAKILVVGDFILDQFIWGSVDRISPEAPVPVVQVNRESYVPGGALNVANNILTLGGKVFPCGVLGRDLVGRMLLKVMKQNAVETGGVIYDPTRPTIHKTRIIAHSQQVVRFDREKVGDVPRKDLQRILKYVESKIREIDGVIIEDYGKGLITASLIRDLLKLTKRHRKFVMVDPKERHIAYYKGVTVITPNRKEAYAALDALGVGTENEGVRIPIEAVGKKLIGKLRCDSVLITLGEEGMLLMEKRGAQTRIPTAAREVFDVSGAGDTVAAAFALSLARGATLKEAAFISNLAAGIVVGKLGTATVNPDELIESFSSVRPQVRGMAR
ncbi:MAG TPA: D-glycero-beta-D-manno-heptose-7-phosphate kinase [Candidatus Omnitrophota bacterium]|nr:D-glycero-beta-D-manno-heptose-7-phosphate kinase [Candidatus Omnitrophota bacterium]